ncbi:MAG TPA: 30S ribosomal protein S8 [Acidimicrobiia bacterium]|jgi:small subunit ribosomal protein S8|nr:30S ribosomal protein S8 [Acidimicrobiia bacterium]
MVTDPIADMLTRIRNAVAVGHERVVMPSSKLKVDIAQILVNEGFIDRFQVSDNGHRSDLELVLRYAERRKPVIIGLKRVSRPGHRVYRGAKELPRVQGGLGVAVVSTSQGLMPDREARKRSLGGEILCEVW